MTAIEVEVHKAKLDLANSLRDSFKDAFVLRKPTP
jgi:hypothetical protein